MDSVIGLVGLQLEATDSEADMDDNSIYYFSGKDEAEAVSYTHLTLPTIRLV